MDDHYRLYEGSRLKVAVDLPLGLTDDGMNVPPDELFEADVTLALGALKRAHVLPSARHTCGSIVVINLGLDLGDAKARTIRQPALKSPAGDFNKFDRGVVGVIAGRMPGAAHLAATAAARAGAGYVILFGDAPGGPEAIVRRPLAQEALRDSRIGTCVIGPGLGRDDDARRWLDFVLTLPLRTVVLDADALRLLDPKGKHRRLSQVILTPHYGEYRHIADDLAEALTAARALL